MKVSVDLNELTENTMMEVVRAISDSKQLTKLAKNENVLIRRGVASNKNTNTDLLKELAKDEFWYVREGVASNKNTDEDTLNDLRKNDENEYVAEAAADNLFYTSSSEEAFLKKYSEIIKNL